MNKKLVESSTGRLILVSKDQLQLAHASELCTPPPEDLEALRRVEQRLGTDEKQTFDDARMSIPIVPADPPEEVGILPLPIASGSRDPEAVTDHLQDVEPGGACSSIYTCSNWITCSF